MGFNEDLDQLIKNEEYIEAYHKLLNSTKIEIEPANARNYLFNKQDSNKILLIEALKQAVSQNNFSLINKPEKNNSWVYDPSNHRCNDKLKQSFIDYRTHIIETLFDCAQQMITEGKREISSEELNSLYPKTHFSPAFLADCFKLLGNKEPLESKKEVSLPVIAVIDGGKKGCLGSLHLEKIDLKGVLHKPYPHPEKMLSTFIDSEFERVVDEAFQYLCLYSNKLESKERGVVRYWLTLDDEKRVLTTLDGPSHGLIHCVTTSA
jgi:hypothetical protein